MTATTIDNPRWMTITGRVLSTLVVLFLLMDAGIKLPRSRRWAKRSARWAGLPMRTWRICWRRSP